MNKEDTRNLFLAVGLSVLLMAAWQYFYAGPMYQREHQAQMQAQEGAQRTRLLNAQRLWIQYRDANCGFYAGADGSLSRIQAADCMFKMTRGRTQELESGELP